jgi:AraC family transcriptional regulator of adaptative response / DNA-3-methyladenine glycosylase II
MELDWQTCSRARLARDARFDGKFFIGVLTTKIYCRPICRSRTSKESNVRYFPTAAAAAEGGFRPCLRCRPECSPGTPAWAGTQNTVSRALRLISETGLEEGGVEALAEHLGMGSRHLRRLFLRHLGATPSAVAQTRRLHFAKKLIDETTLSMTQIAFAAGFGSVRRFNAAIRNVYHRTPTQIRRVTQEKSRQPENHYLFHLHFRPPYDWKRMLEFLAAHAVHGVEAVEGGCFRRSISVNEHRGFFEVSLESRRNALNVRVQLHEPRSLFFIIERIRAMFDLDADWATIARTLGADRALAAHVSAYPGIRVPGCWNGFEFAVRTILREHASITTAKPLICRMVKAFGEDSCPASGLTHLFPAPGALANASLESVGVPGPQADAIRALARAVHRGQIRFERIADTDAFLSRLSEIPGITESVAQWVAVRALREPDAFPSADRNLALSLGIASPEEFEQRSLAWRPWRAYAAMYLRTFAGDFGVLENSSATSARKKAASAETPFHARPAVAVRRASSRGTFTHVQDV